MTDPLLLEFPAEEYESRIRNLTCSMAEQDLDAVILTSRDQTRYFCGFQIIVWISNLSKPGALIITRDGRTIFVGPLARISTVEVTAKVDELNPWDPQGRDGLPLSYAGAIHRALLTNGVSHGRLGMETGPEMRMHLSHDDRTTLWALLSNFSIVDAGPAIWPLRAVKSQLEIERLRKACHINSIAFERTLESIYDGMLEMEIHQKLCIEMYTQGAEETLLNGVRSGPKRYSQGNSPPGYRPVAPGDIIIMDGGPVYRGYYSDIIRQAIIGPPTPRQRDLYEVAVDTCYTGLDLIREGAVPEEISNAVDTFAGRSRFSEHYRSAGWCGHSLGLTVHEPPMIEVGNRRPLQAGNVLAIEPDFLEEGVGVFGIEQNVLVTEDGYELLSPVDHGLWVI